MKILILNRILWSGGVQRVAIAQAQQLTRLGHEVDLVFIRKSKIGAEYDNTGPIRFAETGLKPRRLLGGPLRLVTTRYASERGPESVVDLDSIIMMELRTRGYEMIIYGDQHVALFSGLLKFLRGAPYIVTIHETALKTTSSLWKLEERVALFKADAIVTVSKSNLELLKGAGHKHVHLIYPGTTVPPRVPAFSEREDIALSVTMWDVGRRPEVFLPVASRLRSGRIFLAGSWADPTAMRLFKEEVKKLGLEGKIVITGPITEEELYALYNRSKVAIRFGYDERGMGMGSLEALGYGLPLIINNGIGVQEILSSPKSRLIVKELDANAVANEVDSLFTDKARWSEISDTNRRIAQAYSWDSFGTQLNDVVKSVASRLARSAS